MICLNLKNKNIGFCLTGSFCMFKNTILQMKELVKEKANILPIMSYNPYKTDDKFGKVKDFIKEIEDITGNKVIHTIKDAEAIGIKNLTDIMIIAPCSDNTVAKLSNGITDTPVLVAAKFHLRSEKPLVIAISTTDGLSRKCRKYRKVVK